MPRDASLYACSLIKTHLLGRIIDDRTLLQLALCQGLVAGQAGLEGGRRGHVWVTGGRRGAVRAAASATARAARADARGAASAFARVACVTTRQQQCEGQAQPHQCSQPKPERLAAFGMATRVLHLLPPRDSATGRCTPTSEDLRRVPSGVRMVNNSRLTACLPTCPNQVWSHSGSARACAVDHRRRVILHTVVITRRRPRLKQAQTAAGGADRRSTRTPQIA
jgi:hypothetical protein